MEPETLSTTSEPLGGAADLGPMPVPPTHRVSVEGARRVNGTFAPPAVGPDTPRNGHGATFPHANGHANGHGALNGHADSGARVLNGAGAVTVLPHAAAHRASFYLRFGKRLLDLLGALGSMVVLSPLMLVVAIAIKLESRGPVFYRSTRIGRDGRPFTFLKFRSMFDGADRQRQEISHLNEMDGPIFKISRDPRVTRIGRFLRVTSIDEIPQFLNVLRGEMSLVGPRPPIPEEVAQYEPWQFRRLDVKPGITCLWQISGRSRLSFKEWMRLDLEYIKHQSLWLDLRILLRTIPAVLSREGAY